MKLNQEIYFRPCVSHKVSLMSMWQTKILEYDHLLDSLDSKHILKQDCIISHTDSFVRLWPHEESSRVLNTWNEIHNIWRGFYIATDQYQGYYYQLYRVIQAVQILLRQTTLVILDFYDFYAQILLHKSHQKMNTIHMYM